MMIPDRKPNQYAATAYNSEQLPPLQPEDLPINKPPFFCKSLPFGHTDIFNVPKYFYETSNPATLRETEQKTDQELIDDANKSHVKIDMCWNHRCIRYDTFASLAHVLITLYLIAKICIPIGFIGGTITSLVMYFMLDVEIDIMSLVDFVALMTGMPLAIFILCWLITSLPPKWWMKSSKGAQWELNRETGMVSIFNYKTAEYKKTGKPTIFAAPFIEFEALLNQSPTRHGGTQDALLLKHRVSGAMINFACFSQGIRGQEWLQFWHFIENYMDISKSLPDIPILEQYRQYDSTTQAYDAKTERNPRFWRNMEPEAYTRISAIAGMSPTINPDAHPCILVQRAYSDAEISA